MFSMLTAWKWFWRERESKSAVAENFQAIKRGSCCEFLTHDRGIKWVQEPKTIYIFPRLRMWLTINQPSQANIKFSLLFYSDTTYKIRVHTADVRNAGTDANVFLMIFGSKGDSGELALKNSETHRDKFERGQTDDFTFSLLSLGKTYSLISTNIIFDAIVRKYFWVRLYLVPIFLK